MKKRLMALLTALSMSAAALSGCADDVEEEGNNTEESGETEEKGENTPKDTEVKRSLGNKATDLQVSRSTGKMTIDRGSYGNTSMGSDGTWTVFVYLCGTDLESGGGMASGDVEEMLAANSSDKVHYVVQTGGADDWYNSDISSKKNQRFLIEDNSLKEVYSESRRSMADVSTLTDFLRWGVKEYPAEHMGVIIWNHGGGSITGVCFDELDDRRSLSLRDLDNAFLSISDSMTDRFEFIGFDACLMGTVETANILAPYARYMVGSEEIEPGYGWDYEQMGDFLAKNPDADGAQLGRIICDGFYEMCESIDSEDEATLSVIDLDKIDDVLVSFNDFAKEMYEAGDDQSALADMIRGIEGADNFGGNNRSEGYTNMVDMGGLVEACSEYSSNASAVIKAIDNAVVYNKVGRDHKTACGLSTYYPLGIEGSEEMKIFGDLCISPYYLSFVERQDYSTVYGYGDSMELDEENTYYDEDTGMFYFEDGDYLYAYDQESGTYYYYDEDDEEWYELDDDSEYYDEDNEDTYYDEEEGIYYFEEDDILYAYDVNEDVYYYYDEDDDEWYDLSEYEAPEDYSDDYWYDDDDTWSFGFFDNYYDESSGCYRSKPSDSDRWDYSDDYEITGESKRITFSEAPAFNADGYYSFTLDKDGIENAALVYAYVFDILEDEGDMLLLGETYDVYGDWDSGHFEDGFDGYWLSLPDGQNLATFIVDYDEDYIIYTSPVMVNGEETNLRLRQNLDDYSVTIEGVWGGIDENGMAARDVRKLKAGDKIVPMYTSFTNDDEMEEGIYEGDEYIVDASTTIEYNWLDVADYLYAFCIDDIYGDYYMSDFVMFALDENGEVSFYED